MTRKKTPPRVDDPAIAFKEGQPWVRFGGLPYRIIGIRNVEGALEITIEDARPPLARMAASVQKEPMT